jgi:hypothetical protein
VFNETGSGERTVIEATQEGHVHVQDIAADGSPTRQDGPCRIDVDGVVELYEHHITLLTIMWSRGARLVLLDLVLHVAQARMLD